MGWFNPYGNIIGAMTFFCLAVLQYRHNPRSKKWLLLGAPAVFFAIAAIFGF
jgi:hypothetical protein